MNKAQALKELLRGDNGYYDVYYDLFDEVIVEELKDRIRDLSDPSNDPFETPDNKAKDIAAFYRVLEWFMMPDDYKTFVKEMSGAKTSPY